MQQYNLHRKNIRWGKNLSKILKNMCKVKQLGQWDAMRQVVTMCKVKTFGWWDAMWQIVTIRDKVRLKP